ncbi:MAG: hypothetical protein GY854_03475 [Deltaproteobacteria bacterium]|nr:hypothetical protein [Deltaproteobacteria bacterium]
MCGTYVFAGLMGCLCIAAIGCTGCSGADRDPDSEDRTALVMSEDQWMYIDADESTFWDKPIAVLTGHKADSGGDLWPYLMSYHPRVRRFGRPTNGAFSGWQLFWEIDPYLGDLHMAYPPCAMVDTDLNMVHGTDIHPEVSIWLEQDDVAQGIDTVVEAAIAWIEDM